MADSADETREGISATTRRRLQQQFEAGSKKMASGDYDYAVEMFTQCVIGDPGNAMYVTHFLGNLQKKYNNNKKGASMAGVRGMGAKTGVKTAHMKKDWPGVIKSALEFLKLNPWDKGTLLAAAEACERLDLDEALVAYLKVALEADLNDVEVNRTLGRAYERLGEFDKAIACWQRVKKTKPNDEEAAKSISSCTVKRTMRQGNYDNAQSSTDVMKDQQAKDERRGALAQTEEQKLEKAIKKNPADVSQYIQLSDLHTRSERYAEAEAVLQRALEASGGEIGVRERLEDVRLRRLREELAQAEQRAKDDPSSEEAEAAFQQTQEEFYRVELEYYLARSDRYPQNLALKFELAVRLQRAGKLNEAIKALQEARADPQRKGDVLLHLGECFREIRQYRLALTHFEDALEEIPERSAENRKRALYNAGALALAMKDLEKADEHLATLAGLDFTYRDVAELLDKIRQQREEEEAEGG